MRKPFKTFKEMAAYLELIRPLQGDDGQGRGKDTPDQAQGTVDDLNKPGGDDVVPLVPEEQKGA